MSRKSVESRDVMAVPLNFLIGASDGDLDAYELTRLAAIADLRKQLHELYDKLIEQQALAGLVRWFRGQDRQTLKHAIENEESPIEWARRQIKERQRSGDELFPLPSLPPGRAHLAAAMRYQERQISKGLCSVCPKPLDANSVRFCTEHLMAARHRMARRAGIKGAPGSADYLYGEITESKHGRQAGTLTALEMAREKKTRAVLAELGIPPESAAVSLNAAKDALLKVIPDSKAKAMSGAELFQAAIVPSLTTGNIALRELVSAGKVHRIGKAKPGHPYRYFAAGPGRAKRELASQHAIESAGLRLRGPRG